MPPGRKKGGSKADNLAKLSVGDLVLAKVKGFPPWPAKISRAEDWDREPDPKKVFVYFFGTGEIAFVAPADVQVFDIEARKSLLARLQGKSIKFFGEAARKICDVYDELKCQDPIGLRDHCCVTSDDPIAKVNAPSKDAYGMDGLMNGDCLVDSRLEPQNLRIGGNVYLKDHLMGRLDETNSTLKRYDLSSLVNGNSSSSISPNQKNDVANSAHSPSKYAAAGALNSNFSVVEDAESQHSKVTLMKSTDQPNPENYTKGSKIKKPELETNDLEGVSDRKNVDSIIHPKPTQKAVIVDEDLTKADAESMRKRMKKVSAAESLASLKLESEASDAKKNGSLVKSKKVLKVESQADVLKNQMHNLTSGRKRKIQLVSKNVVVADNELPCPDSVMSKGEMSHEISNKPLVKRRNVTSSNVTWEKDGKPTKSNLIDEALTVPEPNISEDGNSNIVKECVLALEALSTSHRTSGKRAVAMPTVDVLPSSDPKSLSDASTVDVLPPLINSKPLGDTSRVKRRAVCLVDDVEERPRTPVYRGFSQKVKAVTPTMGSSVKRDAVKGRSKSSHLRNEDCKKSEVFQSPSIFFANM